MSKKGIHSIGRVKKRPQNRSHENYQGGKKARTNRQWESWWFREYNKLCLKCKRACKQSIQAKVIVCPQFMEE